MMMRETTNKHPTRGKGKGRVAIKKSDMPGMKCALSVVLKCVYMCVICVLECRRKEGTKDD